MATMANLDPWDEIRSGRADQAGANIYWLYSGIQKNDLKMISITLKGIIKRDEWRKWRWIGQEFECRSLRECLLAHPPKGVGADINLLRRLIYDDKEALDMMDEALRNESGRPRELFDDATNADETVYNIHNKERPAGTSIEAALRRLRADDRLIAKELHAKVLAGEMSAHRAAVKAGYRKESTSLDHVLKLLPKLSTDELETVIAEAAKYQK